MIRWTGVALVLLAGIGCGKKPNVAAEPRGAPGSPASIDSSWTVVQDAYRRARWSVVQTELERLNLEMKTGDPRLIPLHFMLGEALLGQGSALQAVREFRRVADDTPGDTLAPQALLRAGDAYATLWRRPELDPTYGRSAIATYQEVVTRFPHAAAARQAQSHILQLQDQFAYKNYKAGLYYVRMKAWDSAILYFRDVVATYPRSTNAPSALVELVKAYRVLGYQEDVQETCGYIRRFHSTAAGVADVCPAPADSVPGAS